MTTEDAIALLTAARQVGATHVKLGDFEATLGPGLNTGQQTVPTAPTPPSSAPAKTDTLAESAKALAGLAGAKHITEDEALFGRVRPKEG